MIRRVLAVLLVIAPCGPAPAEPPEGIGHVHVPGTTTHRFKVRFSTALPTDPFERFVEHAPGFWTLSRDSKSADENGSPWTFDIAALHATDLSGATLDDEISGYVVIVEDLDPHAELAVGPSDALVEALEDLEPKPETLLEKRVLWKANPNPFERTEPREGSTRLLDGRVLVIDVQPTLNSDDSSAVNVDYRLRLDYAFEDAGAPDDDSTWQGLSAVLESKGFLRVPEDDDDDELDSIVTALRFEGNWTRWKPESRSFDLLAASSAEIRDARRSGLFDPLDLHVGVHVKHETTQDLDDDQGAVGVGVAVTFPFKRVDDGIPLPLIPLAPLLAVNRDQLATIQQPWFGLSLDYVFSADGTSRADLTDDDDYARLLLEVGWTSEIVAPNTWLYFNLSGWWEIDAPSAVEDADDDFHHYLEAGMKIPIVAKDSGTPWFIIKVQDGALPPNFESDTQVKAGVRFEF